MMAAIRSKNTKPELVVRRLVYSLGFRYRLHSPDIPGRPDLVFKGRRKAIFVHGCFWHRHPGCPKASTPETRVDFWQQKFDLNVSRDRPVQQILKEEGWRAMVVWQCELTDVKQLTARLDRFLRG